MRAIIFRVQLDYLLKALDRLREPFLLIIDSPQRIQSRLELRIQGQRGL